MREQLQKIIADYDAGGLAQDRAFKAMREIIEEPTTEYAVQRRIDLLGLKYSREWTAEEKQEWESLSDLLRQRLTHPPEITAFHGAHMYFDWGWNAIGFGQTSIRLGPEGQFYCMNEGMSREATRKLLHAAIDKIADNMIMEEDPK